ncbi:MAG: ketopantoate reductase family protein, partial [Gammaproteobacteria bacterium]
VCVVGAGAIGSLYAGHLGGVVEVAIVTRRREHADQLNANGLRISGKTQRLTRVKASTIPSQLGDMDLVIIATKANDVANGAKGLSGQFPGALFMTVQNGLGCEELVSAHGDWPIISAVTFMSGIRHSDTHVEYELDTDTWMGPWAPGQATFDDANLVAGLLRKAGLKARAFSDLLPAQWSKLIFNAVINSVAALTDLPHVKAYAERERESDLGHLVFAMIEEGKRVAAARNVTLYEDPWEMNVHAVGHGQTAMADYAHIPSMLNDVRARRPTEIDWITGAVVREGAKLGVPVPINETLYRLVKARESGWRMKYSGREEES